MLVKVGDKVYSSFDQPIMVMLTVSDKLNISRMPVEFSKYAEYVHVYDPDSYKAPYAMNEEAVKDWMNVNPVKAVEVILANTVLWWYHFSTFTRPQRLVKQVSFLEALAQLLDRKSK